MKVFRMNSKCTFAGDYRMYTVKELIEKFPYFMLQSMKNVTFSQNVIKEMLKQNNL